MLKSKKGEATVETKAAVDASCGVNEDYLRLNMRTQHVRTGILTRG